MSDPRHPEPDTVTADDLLASRALDGDLTADEMTALAADPAVRARRDTMAAARSWLADVPVDGVTTASAVAAALAAADDHSRGDGEDTERLAPVVSLTKRRRPVWLGAAAAAVMVVAGVAVLARGGSESEEPLASDTRTATVASDAETQGAKANAVEMAQTVVTVDLGAQDPADEPFPMPDPGELLQLRSADEMRWLAEWASPISRAASRCRDGWLVLLPEALFGSDGDTASLVEMVVDPPLRTVLALALDGCTEVASVVLD